MVTLDNLRIRLLDAERVTAADRETLILRPLEGRLTEALYTEAGHGDTILATWVDHAAAARLGRTDAELFARARANTRAQPPGSVDVMKVHDRCRLFILHGDDPSTASHVLDVGAMLAAIRPGLSGAALHASTLGVHGALVGVPSRSLLIAFVIDTGDLLTGSINVATNVLENYDDGDPAALSPHLYWVAGDRIEELGFDVTDGEVESINFPDSLLPLLETSG